MAGMIELGEDPLVAATRTGRAAEDVGPYHRSAPDAGRPNGPRHGPARDVPAPPSARGVRTGPTPPRRAMYPRRASSDARPRPSPRAVAK